MPDRTRRAPVQDEEPQEPPFYVATDVLRYGGRDDFPVNAYLPGDHVPPEVVGPNNWGGKVEIPEQFRGKLAPPPAPTPPEDESKAEE